MRWIGHAARLGRARRSRVVAAVTCLATAGALLMAAPASAATTTTTFTLTSNSEGTGTLPPATVSHGYSVQLADGSAPGADYYLLLAGSLPQGIKLSESGLISGTPVLPESTRVLVEAYNSPSHAQVRLEWLDLTVSSGVAALDPQLIPLGTKVDSTIGSETSTVENLVSTVESLVICLTDPQAPGSCIYGV